MAKPIVRKEGMWEGPWTVELVTSGIGKKVYRLETERTIYMANSLDDVLKMWKHDPMEDNFSVVGLEVIG